jgi:hypothetical protein
MTSQSQPGKLPSGSSVHVMEMLRLHVPLTVFVDLAFPQDLPRISGQRVGVESCA